MSQRNTPSRPEEGNRYRIGTLLFFRDADGRILLLRRRRRPNQGLWCAVGGKLEMASGESPYECAAREASEEVGVRLAAKDLSLRCILAERDYEETGHWLMFVFLVGPRLGGLPPTMAEGAFRFFEVEDLEAVAMPELDRRILLEKVLPAGSGLHVLRVSGEEGGLVEECVIGGCHDSADR